MPDDQRSDFIDAVEAGMPKDDSFKKLSAAHIQILAALSKSEAVDLETLRQVHHWEIVKLMSDLTYLRNDHRIEPVGPDQWGIFDDRIIGKAKITSWGEDGLAKRKEAEAS